MAEGPPPHLHHHPPTYQRNFCLESHLQEATTGIYACLWVQRASCCTDRRIYEWGPWQGTHQTQNKKLKKNFFFFTQNTSSLAAY
jgi:hypothetical protein